VTERAGMPFRKFSLRRTNRNSVPKSFFLDIGITKPLWPNFGSLSGPESISFAKIARYDDMPTVNL